MHVAFCSLLVRRVHVLDETLHRRQSLLEGDLIRVQREIPEQQDSLIYPLVHPLVLCSRCYMVFVEVLEGASVAHLPVADILLAFKLDETQPSSPLEVR